MVRFEWAGQVFAIVFVLGVVASILLAKIIRREIRALRLHRLRHEYFKAVREAEGSTDSESWLKVWRLQAQLLEEDVG